MQGYGVDIALLIDATLSGLGGALNAVGATGLVKMDVRVARQESQRVTAPIDGTVLRVLARQRL